MKDTKQFKLCLIENQYHWAATPSRNNETIEKKGRYSWIQT